MSTPQNDLKERPTRYPRIKITVIGRKSGKTISTPVWFVAEGDTLYLLAVHGSETQWYRNVLKNPSIRIDARGVKVQFRANPNTDDKAVNSVIEKFRGEERGEGREEVLFQVRCGGCGGTGMMKQPIVLAFHAYPSCRRRRATPLN
jgi:deazaflavin-dependent oxidoreductase (nitroreductase family)